MRLRAPELLPKTRALIEALEDGLSGYMTFCARSVRTSQIKPDLLLEPTLAIARRNDWRMLASPQHDRIRTTGTGEHEDFLFMYQRRGKTPRLRQFMACKICLMVDSPDSILSVESEVARLRAVRLIVRRDFADVRSVTTCMLCVVAPHDRDSLGVTVPVPASGGRLRLDHLDTFACHTGESDYGVTTYLV